MIDEWFLDEKEKCIVDSFKCYRRVYRGLNGRQIEIAQGIGASADEANRNARIIVLSGNMFRILKSLIYQDSKDEFLTKEERNDITTTLEKIEGVWE